jgi:hypothetical protein
MRGGGRGAGRSPGTFFLAITAATCACANGAPNAGGRGGSFGGRGGGRGDFGGRGGGGRGEWRFPCVLSPLRCRQLLLMLCIFQGVALRGEAAAAVPGAGVAGEVEAGVEAVEAPR